MKRIRLYDLCNLHLRQVCCDSDEKLVAAFRGRHIVRRHPEANVFFKLDLLIKFSHT